MEHLALALVWSGVEEGGAESRHFDVLLGEAVEVMELKVELAQMGFLEEVVEAGRSWGEQLSFHWILECCGAKIEEEHGSEAAVGLLSFYARPGRGAGRQIWVSCYHRLPSASSVAWAAEVGQGL